MFLPFLAASLLAAAFTHMGALQVRIAILSSSLNALVLLVLVMAAFMIWQRREARHSFA